MNEPVQKPRYGVDLPAVRRFELADIAQHAKWLLPRLIKAYPHLTDRTALGFLNSILYSTEYYFCYQPHAVGLVKIERSHSLAAFPLVREMFVWVEDAKNPAHLDEALAFYPEFQTWAKHHGAETMLVEENSDLPHDLVRACFEGRIFTREQKFVKVKK